MLRVPLGPFDVWEPVGRGGMGVVLRGEHRDTGVPVAVKVLHRHAMKDGEPPESFRNEVRAVAGLDHPGIVWVFDVGVVTAQAARLTQGQLIEGNPYLAMEYASGGTLSEWAPTSWEAVMSMLDELLAALGHAHARQVIHRDLKPGNVLLGTPNDVRPGWKLTDFGIAAALEETVERSIARGIVGTLSYMSPEQIRADWRSFGPWTDLYALGCVLYRVVGGQRVFETTRGPALLAAHLKRKPDPLQPRVPVPDGFAEWVAVLLEKRPADRFQSAAEAFLALAHLGPPVPPLDSGLLPTPLAGSHADDLLADETTADADGPTELVGVGLEDRDRAGVPSDWRRHVAPWPSPRLMGAGLGLIGQRTTPLVGRTSERDVLWNALKRVTRSRGAEVVIIRGPTGVGKTRLARWIGESAHALVGLPFLVGEARRGEAPGAAVARPFRRWFRTHRLADEDRLVSLRTALRSDDDEWVRSVSSVLAPDGVGHDVLVDADARHVVLRRVVERIARPRRPAVLVLDDAHASPDVLRFALHLVRARPSRPAPALVVLVVSDDALTEDAIAVEVLEELRTEAEEVVLGPLSQSVHERLVQAMLPLDRTLAAQVAERTAGNPLHVAQVLQEWVDAGVLVRGTGGFELSGSAPHVAPMGQVWRERVERLLMGLPQDARIVLERAAALGPRVDEEEWQRVCDDPKGKYAAAGRVVLVPEMARLRAAVRARLLAAHLADETTAGWAWTHEMLREAILAMSDEQGRLASHHRACARTLLHHENSRRYAERIGRHLVAGRRPEPAIPQLFEGVRQRRRRLGEGAALPLLAELETALEAAKKPRTDRLWCQVAALRAEVFARLSRASEAKRWADRTVELASAGGWADLHALGKLVTARLLLLHGDAAMADSELQQVEALLPADADKALVGAAYAARSRCARELGDAARSRGYAVLAAEALTDAGDRQGMAEAWAVLGEDALADGRLDDAERFLERARSLYRRGSPVLEANAAARLGEVARARGDLERARAWLERACVTLEQAGSGRAPRALLTLARVHLARRDWGEARRAGAELVRGLGFEQQPALQLAAHAVLVAAAAGARDWASFDVHLERVRVGIDTLTPTDAELAQTLELAAHRTAAAREKERAEELRRLASAVS